MSGLYVSNWIFQTARLLFQLLPLFSVISAYELVIYFFFLSLSASYYTLLNSANSKGCNQYTNSFQKLFTGAIGFKKVQRQVIEWRKIFSTHISDKNYYKSHINTSANQ